MADSLKGVYVLVIQVSAPIKVKVGALGELCFNQGLYAYVGSAQNNLELRVARHLRRDKKLFWHVDYLLSDPAAEVVDAFYKTGGKTEECRVAEQIAANGCEPLEGFGCSDCQCISHLYRIQDASFLRQAMQHLKTPQT